MNNTSDNKNSNFGWKSLDLETKIAIPVIMAHILGVFLYNVFGGVTKK